MTGGIDSGFGSDFVGRDVHDMIIDGIEVPPKNQEKVISVKMADKDLPPLFSDEQIKKIFVGER